MVAINPEIRAAIVVALNDLQAETNIPATIGLKELVGAMQMTNATLRTVSSEQVEAEMLYILAPRSIAVAGAPPGTSGWGYLQADLEAVV